MNGTLHDPNCTPDQLVSRIKESGYQITPNTYVYWVYPDDDFYAGEWTWMEKKDRNSSPIDENSVLGFYVSAIAR